MLTTTNKIIGIILILLIGFFLYLILDTMQFNLNSSSNKSEYTESYKSIEHMINVPKVDVSAITEYNNTNTAINNNDLYWSRPDNCKFYMNSTTEETLKDYNIKETRDSTKSNIIFPCGYNQINNEINALPLPSNKNGSRVFIIDGADEVTAKNWLWKNLVQHHGLNKAKQISPETFILTTGQKDIDIVRLKKNHYPNKLYIMKKNVQRQTGLYITDSIDYIVENKDDYILAQELLQDSYLVGGRKINLRIYILVICHESHVDVYMFNDGFMYYTKQKYIHGNKEFDNHVTTGYIDRDVYDINPLTHQDFKRYLDMNEGDIYYKSSDAKSMSDPRTLSTLEKNIRTQGLKISDVIFTRIHNLFHDIFISFKGNICRKINELNEPVRIYKDYSMQLFGADVAINDQLQPQIIEINKGPDLTPKDDRDGTVKKKLMKDSLELAGLIKAKSNDNGFIKVLES